MITNLATAGTGTATYSLGKRKRDIKEVSPNTASLFNLVSEMKDYKSVEM